MNLITEVDLQYMKWQFENTQMGHHTQNMSSIIQPASFSLFFFLQSNKR